ncbi:membrane protein insertase YidC [Streptococcus massiliensis]|nr:membrane protein insertase YidC [Streptococcus massiliensis]
MILSALIFLSGCVQVKNGKPYGLIWDYLGKPMSLAIEYFANNQGLGYGIGLIIVVILARLIIFPLGIYQSKNATYHSEKRNYLSPIFTPINERMKNAETQEEKLAAQQELMAAQKEHGVSIMGGIGCLPILIQLPFFSAIYFAAANTPGIKESVFLGINLGKPSILLTAIVAILYYLQSRMSMYGLDQEQRDQMKNMMYMSPIMMIMFSIGAQAGVTLYWVVGGLFQILQQLVINYWVRPSMKKKVAAEFEANPPKWDKYKNTRTKDVTPKATGAISTNQHKKKKSNRNAGKQRSR